MSVWKQVTSQVGQIIAQPLKAVVQEPLEIGQTAYSQITGQDSGTSEKGQSSQPVQPPISSDANNLLSSPNDLARYEELSGRKDEIELLQLRKQLHSQWGIETNLDAGMQRVRVEREQKEKQEEEVEVKEKQEKKWIENKKKEQESVAVMAAKAQASGENKAWGAG